MNAAQQLAGMSGNNSNVSSQDSPVRSGLQHERPVVVQQPPPRRAVQAAAAPMYEALDLDDLQNFLSWDMYGISDMGDPHTDDGVDDMAMHSWAGAI